MSRSIFGWGVAAALAFAAAASLPGTPRDAVAGDAKVAESLLKSGRQALDKRDFEGAISFFKKAQEENSDLIEACYWRALAQEKANDKPSALVSYREYLSLFDEKNKTGIGMSKEELRLKPLADKGVETLAAGEKEFKKLEDAYVAQLLAFAKDCFVRDPELCRRATAAILAVRPEHEEAQKLAEKLGGGGAPSAAVGPFKDVKTWRDLIGDQSFRSNCTEFAGGTMVVDTKGGSAVTPAGFIDTGKSFVLENEFRITNLYDPVKWVVGLGFGFKGSAFHSAIAVAGKIVLSRNSANGQHEDLASADVAGFEPNTWHRLGVVVKGSAVEVWFDGKRAITWTEPSGAGFPGDLAVIHEKARSEWRLFRVGKVE